MNQDEALDAIWREACAHSKHRQADRPIGVGDSSCESLECSDAPREGGNQEVDDLTLSDLSDDENDRLFGVHGLVESKTTPGWGSIGQLNDGERRDKYVSSECSSLSVEASDHTNKSEAIDGHISDDQCSLALSLSTESDQAAVDHMLYSSQSDASGCSDTDQSGQFRVSVLLPEARDAIEDNIADQLSSAEASSLSGEMSSSSFEVQYMEDDELDPLADTDDDLWRAFDTALRQCVWHSNQKEGEFLIHTPVDLTQSASLPILYDEGYDGSASEVDSASSLDDSADGSTEEQFFYAGIRADHDHKTTVDVDSHSESVRISSSDTEMGFVVSATNSGLINAADGDDPDDSLSISGEEEHTHQWIENVPVFEMPTEQDQANGVEIARHWRLNEFVEARSSDKKMRGSHQRSDSEESLTLDGEEEDRLVEDDEFSSLTKISPLQKMARIQFDHLEAQDAYVSFAELASIIDAHVTRRPGLFVDLGCGTSRFSEELVFHGYRHVLGIDKDLSKIAFQRQQHAARQLSEYLQFLPVDASQSLLLPDRCCDFLLSKATLDAVAARCVREKYPQELVETLKEVIRCLKPGGVFMAVVYQEHVIVEDGDDLPFEFHEVQTTPASVASARLLSPWWKWKEVKSLIERHLTLVRQYDLGQPRVVDGLKTKPYRAIVWRRKETDIQRLRRLVRDLMDQKRQEHEFENRLYLHRTEREREAQERNVIREFRQMILEDERTRLERAHTNEMQAVRIRQQRRQAFYAALLDDERLQMAWEDTAAKQRRQEEQDLREFVTTTVLGGIVISAAVDMVFAKQAEAEQKRLREAAAHAILEEQKASAHLKQSVASIVEKDSTKTSIAKESPSHLDWIRDEVTQLVDTVVQRGDPTAIHQAQQPPKEKELSGTTQGMPREPKHGAIVKEVVAAAAIDAVEWILSTAIGSLTSPSTTTATASHMDGITSTKMTDTEAGDAMQEFDASIGDAAEPPSPEASTSSESTDRIPVQTSDGSPHDPYNVVLAGVGPMIDTSVKQQHSVLPLSANTTTDASEITPPQATFAQSFSDAASETTEEPVVTTSEQDALQACHETLEAIVQHILDTVIVIP